MGVVLTQASAPPPRDAVRHSNEVLEAAPPMSAPRPNARKVGEVVAARRGSRKGVADQRKFASAPAAPTVAFVATLPAAAVRHSSTPAPRLLPQAGAAGAAGAASKTLSLLGRAAAWPKSLLSRCAQIRSFDEDGAFRSCSDLQEAWDWELIRTHLGSEEFPQSRQQLRGVTSPFMR